MVAAWPKRLAIAVDLYVTSVYVIVSFHNIVVFVVVVLRDSSASDPVCVSVQCWVVPAVSSWHCWQYYVISPGYSLAFHLK